MAKVRSTTSPRVMKAAPRVTKPAPRGFKARVFQVARVAGLASLVFLGTGAFFAQRASASLHDGAMHFGDELMHLNESKAAGDIDGSFYHLVINGQKIAISSTATDKSPTEVLDRFEAQCEHGADHLADQMQNLDHTLAGPAEPVLGGKGFGTVRDQRGDKGFVVCFAEDRDLDKKELADGVLAAMRTGEVGRMGGFRYVIAEKDPKGATHVLATWVDGSFNFLKMFPKNADAPGDDVPDAPRPEGSRRILAATAEGAPYGTIVYESPNGDAEAVRAAVTKSLVDSGWHRATPEKMQGGVVAFERGTIDLVVAVAPERKPGKTTVSYVRSRMLGRTGQ